MVLFSQMAVATHDVLVICFVCYNVMWAIAMLQAVAHCL